MLREKKRANHMSPYVVPKANTNNIINPKSKLLSNVRSGNINYSTSRPKDSS